jgi:hypothetical protein
VLRDLAMREEGSVQLVELSWLVETRDQHFSFRDLSSCSLEQQFRLTILT